MIALAVAAYLVIGAGLGAWIYLVSRGSVSPVDPARHRRLVVLCATVAVQWPGAVLLWALYQTRPGREWIEEFILGGDAR